MKPKILCAALAAMTMAGCVYHHEVKSAPDRDRMEFAAKSGAAPEIARADSARRHD